jgi:hypothetical protein
MTAPVIEDLLRELTPQVLGALVRRHGQFEGCEDAVQEALLAATRQWPAEGVPDNPGQPAAALNPRPRHPTGRERRPSSGSSRYPGIHRSTSSRNRPSHSSWQSTPMPAVDTRWMST